MTRAHFTTASAQKSVCAWKSTLLRTELTSALASLAVLHARSFAKLIFVTLWAGMEKTAFSFDWSLAMAFDWLLLDDQASTTIYSVSSFNFSKKKKNYFCLFTFVESLDVSVAYFSLPLLSRHSKRYTWDMCGNGVFNMCCRFSFLKLETRKLVETASRSTKQPIKGHGE